ncbi:hypothetical protein C6B32_01920 [Campylobacter fetus subsp. testudinum]|uniref:hypothetical protein n=1 Tax=Campylobacter fetus TaxID=196 RepID=UPI000CFD0579|nr:hypothetical protein [Campylobacter fetus]AVK80641.1 hypothetical protein C6B32_01920 [Campylobacter fetus subsp. testudinum]
MQKILNQKDDIKLRDALAVLTGISQTSVVLGCANVSDVTEFDGCIDRCLEDIRDIIARNNITDIS